MPSTPRIFSSIQDLNTERGSEIIKLLKNIAKRKDKISFKCLSIGGRSFIIAISDSYEEGMEYTSWRFKTYIEGLHAMYHEIWAPYHEDIYFLQRAYFHIYKTKQSKLEEEEYLLLHCDASESDEANHSKYKRSPHIHIKAAQQPLPHAHFALNNCDLDHTLSSLGNLNYALMNAIEMINDQVLFHFH